MMDDILKQIKAGEVSGVQFKERILDKYDIACELVAFSNSHGGKLVVGIKDKTGEPNALSYSEVQETTYSGCTKNIGFFFFHRACSKPKNNDFQNR